MPSPDDDMMAGDSSDLVRNARRLRADAEVSAETVRRIGAALAQIKPGDRAATLQRRAEIVRAHSRPE